MCVCVLVHVLAMALCLSVSVSVTSQSFIERDERIDLVFGMKASFDVSTATGVLLSVDQSRGTVYLWHYVQVTSRRRLSEYI